MSLRITELLQWNHHTKVSRDLCLAADNYSTVRRYETQRAAHDPRRWTEDLWTISAVWSDWISSPLIRTLDICSDEV